MDTKLRTVEQTGFVEILESRLPELLAKIGNEIYLLWIERPTLLSGVNPNNGPAPLLF